MSRIFQSLILLTAMLSVGAWAQQEAEKGSQTGSEANATTLSLCNRNADRAIFGAILRQVGGGAGWQSAGWYRVDKAKCLDLDLGSYIGKVYVYAEDEFQQTNWGEGNVSFCVNKTQGFLINNADTAPCTDAALKKVRSDEVSVQAGSNTWEAKPNFTQLNFCNQNPTIPLFVAFAQQTGTPVTWQSQGWYQADPGKCQTASIGKYTGPIQFYAEYNGGQYQYGSGPFQFCVREPSAFVIASADQASLCVAADQKMVKSSAATVVVGVNTINFSAIPLKTILNLCNQTDLSLFAAYAIAGTVAGQWRSTGWVQLAAKKCQTVDLGAYTGKAYLYAEYNAGEKFWGSGPVNFCVNKSQPFTIEDSTDPAKCSQDIALKMVPTFELALVTGTDTFTFNP